MDNTDDQMDDDFDTVDKEQSFMKYQGGHNNAAPKE
jgi:hypothetical protein